jgi:hypothetical protein
MNASVLVSRATIVRWEKRRQRQLRQRPQLTLRQKRKQRKLTGIINRLWNSSRLWRVTTPPPPVSGTQRLN